MYINGRLRLGAPVKISSLVDGLIAEGIGLSTGEKVYKGEDDRPIIAHAVEQMMCMLHSAGQIEPRPRGKRQQAIWKMWRDGRIEEWDCGDDGKGGEYGEFDAIEWFPLKKRFWIIRSMEN